ncbi:hypothetical protein OIN60_02745 [Paenibacillus sp. P96]|uniref:Serine acetyltransferase n=1 Tax=Paenibacillus zeirhizosphaerae TaxID=2987519 RepID=A0ABT9FM07_9BACL|nr:hypothetical protein [Paenibacillus sp. P96]MDP4095709.1 hypothetical protein [Paenibacillus sp. P96]
MLREFASDFRANRKNPITLCALFTYRFGHGVYYGTRGKFLRKSLWLVYRVMDLIFVRLAASGELHAQAKVGRALHLPHGLNGIMISPKAVIGEGVTIFHQVTVGGRSQLGEPVIGNHVLIGAGAKILGPVLVGDYANIGANAVVIRNVPDYATAVGIPARNIDREEPIPEHLR